VFRSPEVHYFAFWSSCFLTWIGKATKPIQRGRSKKRSFSGNQFTSERDVQNTSASAQKITRVADD